MSRDGGVAEVAPESSAQRCSSMTQTSWLAPRPRLRSGSCREDSLDEVVTFPVRHDVDLAPASFHAAVGWGESFSPAKASPHQRTANDVFSLTGMVTATNLPESSRFDEDVKRLRRELGPGSRFTVDWL